MNKVFEFFLKKYYTYNFLSHNKKIFRNAEANNQDIILIEINDFYPNHILYSYLTSQLSKKFKAQIVGYQGVRSYSLISKFKEFIKKFYLLDTISIYKSFGLRQTINLNNFSSNINHNIVDKTYKSILKNISNKKILNLKIDGVHIGDLLYDDVLRKFFVGSIDINSEVFLNHLYEFIKTFYLWKYYFKTKNVKSIILSHAVYENAIPLRIAQNINIPVYLPDNFRLLRFGKNKKFTLDPNLYREINSSFSSIEKVKLKKIAIKKLKEKFSSKGNDFVEFSQANLNTKSIDEYIKNKKNFFLKDKINILVACHCFYDAPHNFGNLFYNDFEDWLENLGKISKRTNYQWYLKKHPHSLNHKLTDKILDKFVKKYPKFKIIPENIDIRTFHKNIDFILTVYGSVSYEMAYLNKTVILSSRPDHLNGFNFCIIPKNKKEYEKALLNIKKQNKKISKEDIIKFYYLNFICLYDLGNLFPAKKLLKSNYFTPFIYNYWINNFDNKKHLIIKSDLKDYIKNKKSLFWNKKKLLHKL